MRPASRAGLVSRQLVGQFVGIVNLAYRLDDATGVYGDGAGLLFSVNEIEHQRLNVTVEDQTDNFTITIDDRAAGVATDDVGRADEVIGRLEIELALTLDPARRQIERRLIVVLGGTLVEAGKRGLEGDMFAGLFVAFDDPES